MATLSRMLRDQRDQGVGEDLANLRRQGLRLSELLDLAQGLEQPRFD